MESQKTLSRKGNTRGTTTSDPKLYYRAMVTKQHTSGKMGACRSGDWNRGPRNIPTQIT